MSSSSSSYGAYTQANKGTYASRPSTSSTYSSTSSASLYAQSGRSSSRSAHYSKPPVIIHTGGQINDPNTSSSAQNGDYYR